LIASEEIASAILLQKCKAFIPLGLNSLHFSHQKCDK